MRTNRRLLMLLFSAALPNVVLAGENLLSPHGYGKIKFGTKLSDAEADLKEHAIPRGRESGCDFVRFKKYPGIRFMVEGGIVTRADASSRIRNTAGVREGMSMARVKSLHPHIKIEPHKYDDSGHYLILSSSDKRSALVFEEGDGKITEVRAGIQPSVQYVEGCL